MAKRWPPEEDAIIKCHYQDKGSSWVVEHLQNRTQLGVTKRAVLLGVKSGCHWNKTEDFVISTCYEKFCAAYCRRYLPRRTEIAIMSRARRLGFARDLRLKQKDRLESHDEIGCMQAAIKTGWMNKPAGLPDGFFDLSSA